jgi:nucleoside-diphosphate-sugar epimerase
VNEKPHQQKLKVRKYIDENLKGGDMEITYLVTGPYSDLYLGKGVAGHQRAGCFDVKAKHAAVAEDGNGKVSFTTMKDVGVLLVAALKHPAPSTVRVLRVNSFTSTPLDIVKEFEKQTGDKWSVEHTPLEEMRKTEDEMWGRQDPLATVWTLRRIWAEGATLYDERDNGKIGEPEMEGLESQVKLSIEKQMEHKTSAL